jgi:hypothetical protein
MTTGGMKYLAQPVLLKCERKKQMKWIHIFFTLVSLHIAFSTTSVLANFAPQQKTVYSVYHNVTHPHKPAAVNCYRDTCDGIFPHTTDGGSNCVSRSLTSVGSLPLYDDRGQIEGHIQGYNSGGCNATWPSVYTDTTYMKFFQVYILRDTQDDPVVYHLDYYWPNYPNHAHNDGWMEGHDPEPAGLGECFSYYVEWQDRDGVYHDSSYESPMSACWH